MCWRTVRKMLNYVHTPSTRTCNMLVVITLLSSFTAVTGMQTFEREPEYTEVNPGQTTLLHCKIFNQAGQCSWQKDGYPIGPEQDKYEWAGSPDQGDCSLRVISADLKYDDGSWLCQVTASSFQTQDALTSSPARLVVRVEPKTPQIEFEGIQISSGGNLTVRDGQQVDVQCRARYGNPPALIKWFMGEDDLTGSASQQNQTEVDRPRTWAALSSLRHTFTRTQASQHLRCVAVHQAYDTKSRGTTGRLNIEYAPEVRLVGLPDREVEDNVDVVVLECRVDANPSATVVWRFVAADSGRAETFYVDTLEFKPVTQKNAGSYQCEAGNAVGKSDPLSTTLDVKYAPKITALRPARQVTVGLYNTTELVCEAAGNPPPAYQWLQRVPTADGTVYIRGSDRVLRIQNITYDNSGSYVCVAKNTINGVEKRVQSDTLDVRVTGPPQLLRHQMAREVTVEQAHDGMMEAVFCSNPPPTSAVWIWGSVQLAAGRANERYAAEEIRADGQEDCYRAKLQVQGVVSEDERSYFLQVTNDRGADQYGVALKVRVSELITAGFGLLTEPVTMTTVIVIISACLLMLLLVVALLLYAYKKQKWCFSQKGGFKPTDLESEKSELDGDGIRGPSVGVIPPDALYSGPRKTAVRPAADNNGQYEPEGPAREARAPSRGSIIYADLQLPKTSNHGSMRKQRQHGQRVGVRSEPHRTEYAEIKFNPPSDERADI